MDKQNTQSDSSDNESKQPISFAEFLVGTPPNALVTFFRPPSEETPINVNLPQIELHCEKCQGERFFAPTSESIRIYQPKEVTTTFVGYTCRNCGRFTKTYALGVLCDITKPNGRVFKFGEFPAFGPHTPPRMLRMIQSDRELFFQGRRAESQGMGIGAFAYYRRVVENQKNNLIDEIIKVSERLQAPEAFISSLKAAKREVQFSSAVEKIEGGLPDALKINGYNPLTLLHAALSNGIHVTSDAECLELAQDIRLVLSEFAEKVGQALKDHAGLNEAVTRLAQASAKSKRVVAPSSAVAVKQE